VTKLHQSFVTCLLLLSPLMAQKQAAEHVPKIICKPPSMKVLKMVRPTFPPDAKAKDIFGKVAVEARIDKDGRPTSVRVLKGNPVLTGAVVEAVKQWRWKPLKLNGQAVEASTTITVNFEPR
jgi:TonB family protein